MLIRDIVGTTLAGLTAAALALAPALFQAPVPASSAAGTTLSGSPAPGETSSAFVHPCPETTESECRAVFLPPIASDDPDGAAHTGHQPEVQICGPLGEGVATQSVSSCDDAGTGGEVESLPFGCGNPNDCVKITGDHYHANWNTGESGGGPGEARGKADDGLEDGYYLIDVRLNGSSSGGVVVELGQGGGRGQPPKFNNGSTIPLRFRLHDKIIG